MPAAPATLAALQRLLDGASWLGAEIDLQYRVLALTIEPGDTPTSADDPRRQVLLSPASTIKVCLRVDEEPPRVESFEVEQLPDVVAAMDAPALTGQMVGPGDPSHGWPALSLGGRSNAPDGHTHRVHLAATTGARTLELFATFDEVEVRDAQQQAIDLV